MKYVDGVVTSVKTARKAEMVKFSRDIAPLFTDAGAIHVVDTWGDEVPEGKLTSFPMAVKAEADETVCFSWVTWPSKEARAEGWKKIEADERFKAGPDAPFDGKRMIFGCFEMIAES